MRIVAIRALTLGARMLKLGFLDLLSLLGMASDAHFLHALSREYHPPVFRSFVTHVAESFPEWLMDEGLHELRPGGLVRIVTGDAIRLREGLSLMRLDQVGIAGIMAVEAQGG